MAEILIADEKLILGVPFSQDHFSRKLEIPLKNVTGVGIDPPLAENWLKRLEFLAGFVPSAKREGVLYEDRTAFSGK